MHPRKIQIDLSDEDRMIDLEDELFEWSRGRTEWSPDMEFFGAELTSTKPLDVDRFIKEERLLVYMLLWRYSFLFSNHVIPPKEQGMCPQFNSVMWNYQGMHVDGYIRLDPPFKDWQITALTGDYSRIPTVIAASDEFYELGMKAISTDKAKQFISRFPNVESFLNGRVLFLGELCSVFQYLTDVQRILDRQVEVMEYFRTKEREVVAAAQRNHSQAYIPEFDAKAMLMMGATGLPFSSNIVHGKLDTSGDRRLRSWNYKFDEEPEGWSEITTHITRPPMPWLRPGQ